MTGTFTPDGLVSWSGLVHSRLLLPDAAQATRRYALLARIASMLSNIMRNGKSSGRSQDREGIDGLGPGAALRRVIEVSTRPTVLGVAPLAD